MKYFHLKSLLTVLLSLCCAVVSAQSFESNGISYSILSLSDRTVEVAHNANYQGFIIIPSTADYSGISFKVTGIGNGAFTSTKVTEMILSEGVTYIGNNAFNFSSLKEIIIPNSVTSIGEYAFRNCTGLKSITIPNSVTSIENYTFEYCTGLTSITIPNSVTSIGDYAFRGCTGITSVTIPNSVTSIEENAFYGCTKLKLIYNDSSLNLTIGSSQYGYVAYYAKIVITNKNDYTIVDDYIFNKTDGVYTLIAYVGIDSQISLPLEINGTNYVIGKSAFSGCTELSHITIPNNVTTIGQYAFSNCTNLTSVTIPNGITKVENSTFSGCTSLTSVTIPNSVTTIGQYAFSNCTSLTSVTIPNSVTTIGQYAFSNCTSLGSLEIPNSVTRIEIGAFDNCRCLSSIKIPNGITSIANNTFQSCRWLTRVTIPNSVTTIGDGAFNLCGLTSVVIPNSVTSIGSNAFSQCSNLTSVTIPNSVTSIGSGAFWECSGLKSITIPNSVTSIGQNVFSGCTSLTSVTIPNSVTSIGQSAFSSCTNLASITIPNSVTSIGQSAFSSCTGLTSVIIPNSVTTIGSSAFWGCSGLKSVTIPNSVTSIGSGAFEGCTGLTAVHISNFSAWCKIDFRNAGYTNDPIKSNPLYYAKNLYLNGELLTDLVIPNGITEIKKYAFYCCSSLRSITIPNSITTIEERAFESCSGLTSVTIPNSVTTIGNYAFEGCTGLTAVHISNLSAWCKIDFRNAGYTNDPIKSNPLYYAKNLYLNGELLTDLVIPNGITEIKKYAFYCCSSLRSITIPNSITTIEERAFESCSGLTSVTIPNSVTTIGNYAFDNCSSLASVTIPNSVTTIGGYAFSGCTGLTSVTIPNSVKWIGDYAFYGCTGLAELYVKATEPPTIYSKTFNKYTATLHVPTGSKTAYQAADYWKEFTNIEEFEIKSEYGDIVFKILSTNDRTCEITFKGSTYDEVEDEYTGNIVIPEKITFIGEEYTVTSIAANAFSGCTGLTSITIPNSVTSIGDYAFASCSSLASVTIPNSVTKINDSSFDNCTALKNMHIEDASTALSLGYDNNPSSATGKGQGLFYDSPLVTLYIGRDLSYPASNNAGYSPFMNKRELTSLTIGDKVTSIGENAFAGCSGLTNVTIGASVTTIGLSAFSGCFKLTHIKIKAKTPPTKSIDNRFISVFDDYSATLYVPKGTKTAYQTASVWKNFKNIVEIEEEEPATPGDITGDGIVNVGDITTIASMILDESLMNDAADINNDGIVNVGDITTLVSMILGSNSAPARAAVTGEVALPVVTASMDADNSILINVANPDYPFTAAQFDLSFEGGIGIVNDGEYYDVFLGSRTSSRNHSEPECNTQPDGSLRVVILSLKNKVFDGEEGDIATVALDVTGVADGVYQYTIKNIALSDPNSQLQYPADATGMITVNGGVISAVTGINSITADGENANEAIYDLSGRKVANPVKGGIYIKGGKKFIM